MIAAVVFDAFGTLFNVDSIAKTCEKTFPGNGPLISRVWRRKQLEYTWIRSMMNRYVDFTEITKDALRYALHQMGLRHSELQLQQIMDQYARLPLYSDAEDALKLLSGCKRAILSNGTESMLRSLVQHAGIVESIEEVLSADVVKMYKPHPSVYELVETELNTPKENVLFVSSNAWDVVGAKAFGFQVAWVNRKGDVNEKLGEEPDFTVTNLTTLAKRVTYLNTGRES